MDTPGSSIIATLDFSVVFDLSTPTPTIKLTNLSTAATMPPTAPFIGCKWWVLITSPSTSIVHQGSLAAPDMTGAWTTWTMANPWPQLFQHVEWSGAPYTVTLYVNDANVGNTNNPYSLAYSAELCPPRGNTGTTTNNFGVASMSKSVKCTDAQVVVQDLTNYTYKALGIGVLVSEEFRLISPALDDGSSAPQLTVTGLSYAYFNLVYNGDGYNVFLNTVRDYALDSHVTVRFKYKGQITFNVQCNIDLCSITCGFQKLVQKLSCAPCADSTLRDKALLISSKINLCLIGISSGCTDVDISKQISDIKSLLGDFDCCVETTKNTGLFPLGTNTDQDDAVITPVYLFGTTNPPVGCPSAFAPGTVTEPDGTTIIGIFHDSLEMVQLMNDNPAWQAIGLAFAIGNCEVGVFPKDGVTVIPPVIVIVGSGCVDNVQSYTVHMSDICAGSSTVTVSDFPLHALVDFGLGAGPVYLGFIATFADLIIALNAEPTKPPSVLFADAGASSAAVIAIHNDSCSSYSGTITVTCDLGSSSFLTIGSGHRPYNSTPLATNGNVQEYGMRGNAIIGRIPGISATNIQWHNIRIGNTLIVSEGDTGKIHFIDMTNPLMPSYIRFIQLNKIVATSFSGGPLSKGVDGGNVSSFYSLYFPTDSHHMTINLLYVCEGLTGTFWGLDMAGSALGIGTGVVNAGGSGWVVGNLFTIGAGSVLAVAQVTTQVAGAVTGWMLLRPGEGYTVTAGVACTALTGVGAGLVIDILTVQSGVSFCFQDLRLRGMCPRVHVGSKIYFSLDGSLAVDIGAPPPVAMGFVMVIDFSLVYLIPSPAAVVAVNVAGLGTPDDIWAASYDGVDTIWMMGYAGTLYRYSISSGTSSIKIDTMGPTGASGFQLRGNIKYYLGKLYISSLGGLRPLSHAAGAMVMDLASFPTSVSFSYFGLFTDPSGGILFVHNILPLGNCLCVVTCEGFPGNQQGTIAVYKLDGTLMFFKKLGLGQSIYNLVPVAGINPPYSPTTLIPIP